VQEGQLGGGGGHRGDCEDVRGLGLVGTSADLASRWRGQAVGLDLSERVGEYLSGGTRDEERVERRGDCMTGWAGQLPRVGGG
jgi:hypothetical protein